MATWQILLLVLSVISFANTHALQKRECAKCASQPRLKPHQPPHKNHEAYVGETKYEQMTPLNHPLVVACTLHSIGFQDIIFLTAQKTFMKAAKLPDRFALQTVPENETTAEIFTEEIDAQNLYTYLVTYAQNTTTRAEEGTWALVSAVPSVDRVFSQCSVVVLPVAATTAPSTKVFVPINTPFVLSGYMPTNFKTDQHVRLVRSEEPQVVLVEKPTGTQSFTSLYNVIAQRKYLEITNGFSYAFIFSSINTIPPGLYHLKVNETIVNTFYIYMQRRKRVRKL